MYVHTCDISKLDTDFYRTLFKLNFRKNGRMQEVLQHFYQKNNVGGHARVFWIEIDDKVVSWALVFAFNKNRKTTAYFYTRRSYRRLGYASKLIKAIEKRYNIIHVHPHDGTASSFFNTVKTRKIRRVRYY